MASETKLPPLAEEVFDGEKESTTVKVQYCNHKLKQVSPQEAKCQKCGVGYMGDNIQTLINLYKSVKN